MNYRPRDEIIPLKALARFAWESRADAAECRRRAHGFVHIAEARAAWLKDLVELRRREARRRAA
ncbi:MAG TPA: hypothetical protein VFV19_03025 [Candidatus Polarisedimenticolaceae bacterium]|nr:hypothetical protein [Candidatus Polarisedimenticolaceae bacterium]